MEVISYSWIDNNGPTLNLVQGNWYQLSLNTNYGSSDSVYIHSELNDLGANGLGAPTLVGQSTGAIIDNVFAIDTSIQIGISGSHKGGALYLDNFSFDGKKGSDSCSYSSQLNGVNDLQQSADWNFYSDNSVIHLSNSSSLNIEIINLTGEIIFTVKVNQDFSYNTSRLPAGIYFLKLESSNKNMVRKFVVN